MHLDFVKRRSQCEQPYGQGGLVWRAVGGHRGGQESTYKILWCACVARLRLGGLARGDHSENSKSKWDKGERYNLWGCLSPKSTGPVSSPDGSPGVKNRVSGAIP